MSKKIFGKEKKMALNILLTRIDNRLVHGQVGVTWTSSLGANLLVEQMIMMKKSSETEFPSINQKRLKYLITMRKMANQN